MPLYGVLKQFLSHFPPTAAMLNVKEWVVAKRKDLVFKVPIITLSSFLKMGGKSARGKRSHVMAETPTV